MQKIKDKQELTTKRFEAKQNLTGFFKLLLEIDMRINPELYTNNKKGVCDEKECRRRISKDDQ